MKTTPRLSIILIATAVAIFSCSRSQPAPVVTPVHGSRFTLEMTPGPGYRSSIGFFLFKIPLYPQVACWLETADGRAISTIYVTAKGAKKNWFSSPKGGRPEALPVWYHVQKAAEELPDSISAATASGAIRHDSPVSGLPPGRYVAMLEVNRSYDYNERYTREKTGVNGQPSVVYRCEIVVGQGSSTGTFVPVGTGSPDGSSGSVTPGIEGLTTALTLLEKATITYQPS